MSDKLSQPASDSFGMATRTAVIPRSGDLVDFDRLYQLYGRRVYSWCAQMTGDAEEAEDLSQDSFLQLFRSIDTFRGEAGFLTWFYRVVANVVQGRFRKKKIHTISLHAWDEAGHEALDFPDLSATDEVDRLSLEKLMVKLPSVYRTIVELHDIRGFRHVEIAKMLGMPVGTTKAYLHRARRQLRGLFLESLAGQKKPVLRRRSRGRKKLDCAAELRQA